MACMLEIAGDRLFAEDSFSNCLALAVWALMVLFCLLWAFGAISGAMDIGAAVLTAILRTIFPAGSGDCSPLPSPLLPGLAALPGSFPPSLRHLPQNVGTAGSTSRFRSTNPAWSLGEIPKDRVFAWERKAAPSDRCSAWQYQPSQAEIDDSLAWADHFVSRYANLQKSIKKAAAKPKKTVRFADYVTEIPPSPLPATPLASADQSALDRLSAALREPLCSLLSPPRFPSSARSARHDLDNIAGDVAPTISAIKPIWLRSGGVNPVGTVTMQMIMR